MYIGQNINKYFSLYLKNISSPLSTFGWWLLGLRNKRQVSAFCSLSHLPVPTVTRRLQIPPTQNLGKEDWDGNRAILLGQMVFFFWFLWMLKTETCLLGHFYWLLVIVIVGSLASQGEPCLGVYISIPVAPLVLSASLGNLTCISSYLAYVSCMTRPPARNGPIIQKARTAHSVFFSFTVGLHLVIINICPSFAKSNAVISIVF